MNNFSNIINTSFYEYLNLFKENILYLLLFFLIAIIINKLIKRLVLYLLNKLDQKQNNYLVSKNFNLPFKLFSFLIFLFLVMVYFEGNPYSDYLNKFIKTLFTVFIFWLIYQFLIPLINKTNHNNFLIPKEIFIWLRNSLKFLVITLATVAILETWGIKIGPIIAGLGLLGVAVALGAQDLFKNLISGVLIILENRFKLNDVIELPNHTQGTVENIGFRSTLIRQFDSTPISIPNYVFSESPIINYTNRPHRRINWIIGLSYSSSVDQLKAICSQIEEYVRSNHYFIINDDYKLIVRVEKFNESSIDILINCFTLTNDWSLFLEIKEHLALTIKEIVEKNKSSFAFPSQSIYIEKNN